MSTAVLIFPHQLFQQHPALTAGATVFLIEEYLFFRQFAFHKKKLILHRASMKYYADELIQQGYQVEYVESTEERSDIRKLLSTLVSRGFREVRLAEVTDDWLKRRIKHAAHTSGLQVTELRTPAFLNSMEEVADYFAKKKTYFQTDFYIAQRKKRKILTDSIGQPLGGKWSFDAENRERFPKGGKIPRLQSPAPSHWVTEAIAYTEKNFPENPGETEGFSYPISATEAETWLTGFLRERLHDFGIYEDAMVQKENVLYHSLLSPLINIGLLTPDQVLAQTLDHAAAHTIPQNSLEGFVRQLMGWREFIRIVYEREGRKQRTTNHFGFTRKIPHSFWTGTTGIHPVDSVIRHTLRDGYTHHINRLMVLGNFMLLCAFDPDDVYRWFMEMYVDAYDWVMVPNVYGMTQFADGGLMTTKPYISGSNYLMKMGDWDKGEWQGIWDALFWRFMHVHRDLFLKNPRMGMLLRTFDKMPAEKRTLLLDKAEQFLTKLDGHA